MTTTQEEQRAATGHDFLQRTLAEVDPQIERTVIGPTQAGASIAPEKWWTALAIRPLARDEV